jgi:uncharacterized membrane protein YphA (DoxX/SURF4 family)
MNSKTNLIRERMITYWVTTGLVAVAFFITGIGNLIPIAHIAEDMAHLGYPPYFHIILGTWKIMGAVTIVFPRTPRIKEWAYAGMMFDLTGAAFSRFASSDSVITIIVPIAIAILVVTSCALRPEDRKLKLFVK